VSFKVPFNFHIRAIFFSFLRFGATAPIGPGTPHSRGF